MITKMIIWIASYPKSGNTWIRSLISSLIYTNNGVFNFELLKNILQFPIRQYFKDFTTDYNNPQELKKYWLLAQDKLNLDGRVKFFKTHHSNCKLDNYTFTNKENTLAIIYVVRDPRNLVKSFTNHYAFKQKEVIKFLTSSKPAFVTGHLGLEGNENSVFSIIGSWKDHIKSWTKKKDLCSNILIIKYEDLIKNTNIEILKINNFLKKFVKFESNKKKISNIIKSTSFKNLQNLENKHGFFEAVGKYKKKKFFYLGSNNKWEKYLDKDSKLEIEKKLKNEMIELGYLS